MATVSRKCPHCETTVRLDLNSFDKGIMCLSCGEYIIRSKFPVVDASIDYELENARSLRAIAVSLQVLVLTRAHNDVHSEQIEASYVKAFD